jgi:GT2 family glycosyltransferase
MESYHKKIVSIIVVTYFSEHEIEACLDAVSVPEHNDVEIIVIDNDSKDGTVALLKAKYSNRSNIRLVFNVDNVGFAKGNNQAVAMAEGKYVLILNPDTIAPVSGILEMVDYMEKNPHVGIVGPRIVDEHGLIQESFGQDLTPWNELTGKIMQSKYAEVIPGIKKWKRNLLDRDAIIKVGWIGGACALIRKNLYESIGGINPIFFLSHGDMIDVGKQIRSKGFDAVLYPRVEIVHTGSKSVASNRDESLRNSYIGTLYYFKKYYGPGTVLTAKAVYVFLSLVKSFIAFPVSLFKKDPYRNIAKAHFNNAMRILTGTLGKIE